MVSFTPWSLYSVEIDFGSLPWVGSRAGLELWKKSLVQAYDSVSRQDYTASNDRSIDYQ